MHYNIKKIVIAVDSFKGCLTSTEVENVISDTIKTCLPDTRWVALPLADGGEGTMDVLIQSGKGKTIKVPAHDPLGRLVRVEIGIINQSLCVIEAAKACGLPLLKPEEQNPWTTTTYGVGELIETAIKLGYRNFILTIGGSATNDGGTGLLEALGYKFYDKNFKTLKGVGSSLQNIIYIDDYDVLPELKECRFKVACDVTNPLYGKNGAAFVYAEQKGADKDMILRLDDGLEQWNKTVYKYNGIDMNTLKGAGAAGGLGGALFAFLNAEPVSGIQLVLKAIDFEKQIEDADLIITGEGKIDEQSLMGKALQGILQAADKHGIPVIAITGKNALKKMIPNLKVLQITPDDMPLEEAIKPETAKQNLRNAINNLQLKAEANG